MRDGEGTSTHTQSCRVMQDSFPLASPFVPTSDSKSLISYS